MDGENIPESVSSLQASSHPMSEGLDAHWLFRRCVDCGDDSPTCPTCAPGEVCTQISRTCTTCSSRICVPAASSGATTQDSQSSGGGGPNKGAIAGGVVGGVIGIVLITYLIWRFCIKGRRDAYAEEFPDNYEEYYDEKGDQQGAYMSGGANGHRPRQSTHSGRSMASTVLTRASNVIQIAFIPGITDRGQNDDGHGSIPPVPPVPLQQQASAPTTPYHDAPSTGHPPTPSSDSQDHYFMPHDLRGSTFSDFSSDTESRPYSVASSLARESVASTIYHGETHSALPAQTALRGKANVVSVKSSREATPAGGVPEVPQIDYFKYGQQKPKSGLSKEVDADRPSQHAESGDAARAPATATAAEINDEAVETNAAAPSAADDKDESTGLKESGKGKKKSKITSSAALATAIQEATRRASQQPTHGGLGSLSPRGGDAPPAQGMSSIAEASGPTSGVSEKSPFDDENAAPSP